MAAVHPSRMNLVPRDSRDSYSSRGRDTSPRRNSHRDDDRNRNRSSDRNRAGMSSEQKSRRSRSRSKEKNRRPSPEYAEYRRKSPSPLREKEQAPWRQQEQDAYSGRRERQAYGGGGGTDSLDSRRIQRENSSAIIWPTSPKASARDLSPDDHKRSKRSKRRRRSPSSDSSDSSSEEERRRREKKHRKRSKKDGKEKDRGKPRYDSEEADKDRRTRSRHSSSRRTKSIEQSPPRTPEEEDEWVEKPVDVISMPPPPVPSSSNRVSEKMDVDPQDDEDSDEEVGPQPIQVPGAKPNKRRDDRQYGGALLRGEGSAMAAFLQDDTDVRIPRRGEIGLTSDEIATFEDAGYVMSGSRHKRMNAVRIRKENQVISAEERRGILKLQKEEKERRETVLREEFQELVSERLKGASSASK